jgi:hypothetical protein
MLEKCEIDYKYSTGFREEKAMFEINPYMTNEVYLRQNDNDTWEFCKEGNGTVMTYAILHLRTDGVNWNITKIELTTDANYERKSRDQRYARKLTGKTQNEQAREYFTNTQSESIWIDQYVQKECEDMGEREYDKYQHEVA